MPEYLSPGVYVEEVSTGPKPIEGVSTSVAGILGPTERGPEEIRYITSWLEYTRWFGGHLGVDKSFMSYAVQGFFDNGGKRCFIGRIVGPEGGAPKAANITLGSSNIKFVAYGRGEWGSRLFIRVVKSSKAIHAQPGDAVAKWVRVQILYFRGTTPPPANQIADPFNRYKSSDKKLVQPDVVEDFDDLSLDKTASNSLITTLNLGSRLVRVGGPEDGAVLTIVPVPEDDPFTQFGAGVGGLPVSVDDYRRTALITDIPATTRNQDGFEAMDTIDAVSLLLAPDHVHPNFNGAEDLSDELIKRCQLLKDRFAILSTVKAFDLEAPNLPDTTFAALYHPWIWVYDPVTRDDQLVPPMGHAAGIIARTDIEVGVFKSPANAVVVGAKELQAPLPKGVQDRLNPIGVNCIRDFRSDRRGIRLWGARTLSSDPEWKYINVRRLFLYVEESLDEGLQWVVFESNNEITWGRVQRSITNFLMTIWRAGGLFGAKPEEAFFVRCDRTTMDEDDIQNGRLVCQIGICPVRPAEFVIIRIGQKTADAVS